MTFLALIFYLLSAVIVTATVLAVTRRQVIHAVVYLAVSFLATGLLFYLLGAPFLAVLEVIIYAGAIMVLFLFIVMLLQLEAGRKTLKTYLRQWFWAIILAGLCLAAMTLLMLRAPGSGVPLTAAMADPLAFGRFLFQRYWFAVEITSFLLFIALVGALYLGRRQESRGAQLPENTP
jgi:NADH-quinone oxidoreductase subunit J